MQEFHSQQLEVGDMVLIDWPRTRWDHRRGRVQELRLEQGRRPHAFVHLDAMAVLFPLDRLRRA